MEKYEVEKEETEQTIQTLHSVADGIIQIKDGTAIIEVREILNGFEKEIFKQIGFEEERLELLNKHLENF